MHLPVDSLVRLTDISWLRVSHHHRINVASISIEESSVVFIGLGIILAIILIIGLVGFMIWRRRQQANYFIWSSAPGEPFATLILEQSDNLEPGRRFDLNRPVTTVGRSTANDIVLPDKPVSRTHIELREQAGRLLLVEVKSDHEGQREPPRYGTFVNDSAVPAAGKWLKHGDRIRLGGRTRLRLERPEVKPADLTFDSFPLLEPTIDRTKPLASGDPDATREMLAEAAMDADRTRELHDESDSTRTFSGTTVPSPKADHTLQKTEGDDDGTREFLEPTEDGDQTRELREGDEPPPDSTRAM